MKQVLDKVRRREDFYKSGRLRKELLFFGQIKILQTEISHTNKTGSRVVHFKSLIWKVFSINANRTSSVIIHYITTYGRGNLIFIKENLHQQNDNSSKIIRVPTLNDEPWYNSMEPSTSVCSATYTFCGNSQEIFHSFGRIVAKKANH